MNILVRFLRTYLVETPFEMAASILKVVFIILLLPILILVRFWEILVCLWNRKNSKKLFCEKTSDDNCKSYIPEELMRRPDPCIYSQRWLASQGFRVTWNNPDILVIQADKPIDLAHVERDSYHLKENTDYIVKVRVNNSSIVPALGVRVRLVYRPWSFNSPDMTPVETDAAGNEAIEYVNVPPLSGSTNPNDPNDGAFATFKWHTPPVEGVRKHFCLQAYVYHPMDTNLDNNMGQENTNVYSANPGHVAPGEILNIIVPLWNHQKTKRDFHFEADTYFIDNSKEITLNLKTATGVQKLPQSGKVANLVPMWRTRNTFIGGRLEIGNRARNSIVKYRYSGLAGFRSMLAKSTHPLPERMVFEIPGEKPGAPIQIDGEQSKDINFRVKIPEDAAPGTRVPLNIVAKSINGVMEGGITLLLHIKGGAE